MATPKEESWQLKRRGDVCTGTGLPFADREEIMTRLLFKDGTYLREDYSLACWAEQNLDHGLSAWKSIFHKPVPPEEAVKKESAESLLRKLVAKEDADHVNSIYILTVMLERKKILVEKEVQIRDDQTKVRVYEHKKTGDTFLIVDPELKLAEIENVQEEVVGLLGGRPPKTETVIQFDKLVLLLMEKQKRTLFPRRAVGGEEGITQKLAASFFSLLAGKKHEHYAVSEKVINRYETSEQWGDLVETYRHLLDRIPQEVRFQGLGNPDLEKQLATLAKKDPKALDPNEVRAIFASDDPRIADLRDDMEAAICAATRYATK